MNPLVPGSSPGGPTSQSELAGAEISIASIETVRGFLGDRIQLNALLIVASFVAVLGLSSQSAASWPTYLLGIAMAVNFVRWDDVLKIGYFRLILALVAYLVLTTLWSNPAGIEERLRILARGLLIVLFVVACAEAQLRGQLSRWLGRSLAIVASLAAVAALFFHFQYPDYFPGDRLHGLGQLDNPIIAGIIFGAALIIMLDLVVSDTAGVWRWTALVCGLILLAAIILTDSRSAWFSVAAGLVVYVLAFRVADSQRFFVAVFTLAMLMGIGLVVLLVGESTREILLPRGGSYRFDIWIATLDRISSGGDLLFGLGIATPDGIVVAEHEFNHPHSLYLSVLFQGGLVALSLLVGLIVWTVHILLAHYEARDAKLALGLFTVALSGYALDGHELIDKVSDMWFVFWLPVALALGLSWRVPVDSGDET